MKDKSTWWRVELKINGMYRVWGSLRHWNFPSEAHQEEREDDRQNNATVSGDIAECCSVGEIRSYCYVELAAVIPEPNHWISRYKFPQPLFTSSVPMLSVKALQDLMLCLLNSTA